MWLNLLGLQLQYNWIHCFDMFIYGIHHTMPGFIYLHTYPVIRRCTECGFLQSGCYFWHLCCPGTSPPAQMSVFMMCKGRVIFAWLFCLMGRWLIVFDHLAVEANSLLFPSETHTVTMLSTKRKDIPHRHDDYTWSRPGENVTACKPIGGIWFQTK